MEFHYEITKNNTMKKLYTLIICLGFLQMTYGQVTTNYNAKWFFGVNTGLTWQTTDVANRTNGGWGLTLGKSFNYHTGSFVSFDIRGRFLRGFWYGQDRDTTDLNSFTNQTLSQGETNYRDSLGYAVHNFQTENYLLNLELVAHFNRFRENTRWDPYIFGGIGMNWRQGYGDYLDRDQTNGSLSTYNWDVNNLSKSAIKNSQDGVYETALDGNKQDGFNFGLSHSLGFGLGYQIGKAVTIGVEHKTTVTRTDAFDGYIADGKHENDIYHYTNAFIRFRLFGNSRSDVSTNPKDENMPPVVQFTQPSISGTEVANPNYYVQGNIKNVFDKANVSFSLNGINVTNYTYNTKSDLFASNVTLVEGPNTLVLTGTNQYGADSKTTIIIYKPELVRPPVVSFIQPSVNPTQVSSANYNVVGTVLNVKDKSGVAVIFNGTSRSDFNFNTSNGKVTMGVTLNQGSNTVQITGTNTAGTDSKATTIIYKVDVPVTPPIVFFTDPSSNPVTVGTNTYTIRGKVKNVDSKSGVSFTQNGSSKSNFTFNPATDDFTYSATLGANQNTFVLTGTNQDGTATATTVIVYQRATVNPPVVNIYNPSGNSTNVTVGQFPFGGSITNITSKSQAKLTLNGANVSNFNFNASSGAVTANLNLSPGSNSVVLTGTNADGTDSDQATIIYTVPQPVQPPVVYYTDPSSSPKAVTNGTYTIRGKVKNVDGAQNVTFKKNGASQSGFSYNASTDDFVSTVSLNPGQNTFELIGTNSAGSSSATTILTLNVPTPTPPIVTITNPSGASANTNLAQYPFVGNVQNVNTRSQVKMEVNGNMHNGFTYNSSTGIVTSNLTLNPGPNTVLLKGTNIDGTDSKQVTIVYTPVVTVSPPVVTYINPGSNPLNVGAPNYTVSATVTNVSTPSGVNIKHNGNNVSVFTFGSNNLNFNLNLSEGTNVISVTGTNSAGTDTETTTIIYTKPIVTPPPVVTFVNPGSSGITAASSTYNVRATVLNVSGSSDITVKVNGASTNSFTYSGTTKLVQLTANLNAGTNVIEIKGTNSAGSDVKTTNIVYKAPPCNSPIISLVNPSSLALSTDQASIDFTALVANVTNANQVSIKVGNRNFLSNFNTATNTLTAKINLSVGLNTIVLEATNNCGSDKKTYKIVRSACNAPNVSLGFANIANNQTSYAPEFTMLLNVEHVTNASQVSVTLNNKTIPSTFNSANGTVEVNYGILVGTSTFKVVVTNNCGSKTYTHVAKRAKSPTKVVPTVNITTPATSPITVSNGSFTLQFSTTQIIDKAEIIVRVNGLPTAVSFNKNTNSGSAVLKLNSGSNTVKITVKNPVGTASDSTVIVNTGKSQGIPPKGGTTRGGRGGRGGR